MKTNALTTRHQLTAALTGLALLIHPGLLPTASAGNHGCPAQGHAQHRPHGISNGGWLVRYFDWLMGDGDDGARGVKFLPLPGGDEAGGSFPYDDPGILETEATVSLKRGDSFMIPIVSWIGELYEDGSEDQPLTESVMNESEFLVTIDDRPVVRKTAGPLRAISRSRSSIMNRQTTAPSAPFGYRGLLLSTARSGRDDM